tara:strand:- start:118 stop:666 length:549 start_codon:yes stop_codon:yes gene_type:complete
MKRFISILFLLPVFAQERDLNLTLENDSEVVYFKPEDKVVIRLYKKNILNIKLIPDRNLESTIFKNVDYEEKFILTKNRKILFSDIYSIAHVSNGNIAIKNGIRGLKAGVVGGFSIGFLGTLINNSGPTNPLAVGVMVGTVSSFVLFFEGLIRGYFYSNISKEYIIGDKKWIIAKKNQDPLE